MRFLSLLMIALLMLSTGCGKESVEDLGAKLNGKTTGEVKKMLGEPASKFTPKSAKEQKQYSEMWIYKDVVRSKVEYGPQYTVILFGKTGKVFTVYNLEDLETNIKKYRPFSEGKSG